MRFYAMFAAVALAALGCEKRGDKIIFHGDEAEQKFDEAAEKAKIGAQKVGEEAKELGHKAKEGAKDLRDEAREEKNEIDREAERETTKPDEDGRVAPNATGGGPAAAKDGGVER